MKQSDQKEVLKGEMEAFLLEFEASEETEEDMKTILPIWRDILMTHAQKVGGSTPTAIKALMRVCEDYAGNRGLLERVRLEAEEVRLHLGL